MTHTSNYNAGCLASLLRWFGGTSFSPRQLAQDEIDTPVTALPYGLRDQFLSPAERAFYQTLQDAVQQRAVVCVKVRLADIFFVARPHENRGALNRIAQKHVDFLLCEPDLLRPTLGIELDDSSHMRADRQQRDDFVDRVFAAANLPLLHMRVQRTYSAEHIAAQIEPLLGYGSQPISMPPQTRAGAMIAVPDAGTNPICPKCGIPLVIRTASRGPQPGKRFYGCINYPQCRVMQPLD